MTSSPTNVLACARLKCNQQGLRDMCGLAGYILDEPNAPQDLPMLGAKIL